MKLAVVGSRDFSDLSKVEAVLTVDINRITEIVSGGARGVDTAGAEFAKKHGIKLKIFLPDWDKFGRAAGMIRNKQIVDYCDELIAFWDGKSNGTRNSLMLAQDRKKNTTVIIDTGKKEK